MTRKPTNLFKQILLALLRRLIHHEYTRRSTGVLAGDFMEFAAPEAEEAITGTNPLDGDTTMTIWTKVLASSTI